MSEQFPGLMTTYLGGNAAHRAFRASLANAKALAYVLARKDSTVLRSFLDETEKVRSSSPDGRFAVAVGGRFTSNTAQLAIHLTGTEIGLIEGEPGGFLCQALGLVYREVYRVFETYLVELFDEIAMRQDGVLFSNQQITHEDVLRAGDPDAIRRVIIEKRKAGLTRCGFSGIEKVFEGFGLPIVQLSEPPLPEQEDVHRRLNVLSAIRNIIEHNRSVVNPEFVKLVPDSGYQIGDRVSIAVADMGDALSAVEWTGDGLNQRAIDKFGIDQPVSAAE